MRLHLDSQGDKQGRESRLCLVVVVALMIFTGSAILVMGWHYNAPDKAMGRVVLASPF